MFLALVSSSPSRPGMARQARLESLAPPAQLYRRCSIGTALQARLYTGVALQAQLYRQAQGNPLKEAGRSQTKSQVRGDYAASGCRCFWRWPQSPTSRPGTAPKARLYSHSAGTARQDTALQARLHSGMARQAHLHSTGAALHKHGYIQAWLYTSTALQAWLYTGKARQPWL